MSSDDILLLTAIHAPPGNRRIPFEARVLTMRFKMFKDGGVVGEVEKFAVAKHVGGNRYEFSVEIGGYVFDSYEVFAEDMNGSEIHMSVHNTSLDKGQAMIYKLTVKVV